MRVGMGVGIGRIIRVVVRVEGMWEQVQKDVTEQSAHSECQKSIQNIAVS